MPLAQQWNLAAESCRLGIFLSVAKHLVVVGTPSLLGFQCVRSTEMRRILRLKLCEGWIHEDQQVQRIGAPCKLSDSSGVQLEGVQDGVI